MLRAAPADLCKRKRQRLMRPQPSSHQIQPTPKPCLGSLQNQGAADEIKWLITSSFAMRKLCKDHHANFTAKRQPVTLIESD